MPSRFKLKKTENCAHRLAFATVLAHRDSARFLNEPLPLSSRDSPHDPVVVAMSDFQNRFRSAREAHGART